MQEVTSREAIQLMAEKYNETKDEVVFHELWGESFTLVQGIVNECQEALTSMATYIGDKKETLDDIACDIMTYHIPDIIGAYDPRKSKYYTYLKMKVKYLFFSCLENYLPVKVPNYIMRDIRKYIKTYNDLETRLKRRPTEAEIMEYGSFTEKKLKKIRSSMNVLNPVSGNDALYATDIETNSHETKSDMITYNASNTWGKTEDEAMDNIIFDHVLTQRYKEGILSEKEMDILYKRQIMGFSQEECGKFWNISHTSVRNIEKEAIRKLKENEEVKKLLA